MTASSSLHSRNGWTARRRSLCVVGMWRVFLLILLTVSSALAEQQLTAYEAMKTVGRQLGRGALKNIISVTGVAGDPQPTRWSILLVDRESPSGVREIQVSTQGILRQGAPRDSAEGARHGATLPTSKLNLDSDGAFKVASYTADQSHVNFHSVAYTLRVNEREVPVWRITVLDEAQQSLGTITINASRGTVTRVEGLYRGANMINGEPAPGAAPPVERRRTEIAPGDDYVDEETVDEDAGDENVVKAEIKRVFRQGRDGVRHIFERVQRSFEDFFNRN